MIRSVQRSPRASAALAIGQNWPYLMLMVPGRESLQKK